MVLLVMVVVSVRIVLFFWNDLLLAVETYEFNLSDIEKVWVLDEKMWELADKLQELELQCRKCTLFQSPHTHYLFLPTIHVFWLDWRNLLVEVESWVSNRKKEKLHVKRIKEWMNVKRMKALMNVKGMKEQEHDPMKYRTRG